MQRLALQPAGWKNDRKTGRKDGRLDGLPVSLSFPWGNRRMFYRTANFLVRAERYRLQFGLLFQLRLGVFLHRTISFR